MTEIFLIRHGEIPVQTPRCFIGRTDMHLTEKGREQMFCLADHLKSFRIEELICSSLSRCVESGAILGDRLSLGVEKIDGLEEISLGSWEGLSVDQVKARFPGSYERRGRNFAHFRPDEGESFFDLQERCWPVFEDIAKSGKRSVAIVAHAGVNRVLLCQILGMPLENLFRIEQQYGCFCVINCYHGGYRLLSMNCCPV